MQGGVERRSRSDDTLQLHWDFVCIACRRLTYSSDGSIYRFPGYNLVSDTSISSYIVCFDVENFDINIQQTNILKRHFENCTGLWPTFEDWKLCDKTHCGVIGPSVFSVTIRTLHSDSDSMTTLCLTESPHL